MQPQQSCNALRLHALSLIREYGSSAGIYGRQLSQLLRQSASYQVRFLYSEDDHGRQLQKGWLWKLMRGVKKVGVVPCGNDRLYYLKEGVCEISMKHAWQHWQHSCYLTAMAQQNYYHAWQHCHVEQVKKSLSFSSVKKGLESNASVRNDTHDAISNRCDTRGTMDKEMNPPCERIDDDLLPDISKDMCSFHEEWVLV